MESPVAPAADPPPLTGRDRRSTTAALFCVETAAAVNLFFYLQYNYAIGRSPERGYNTFVPVITRLSR